MVADSVLSVCMETKRMTLVTNENTMISTIKLSSFVGIDAGRQPCLTKEYKVWLPAGGHRRRFLLVMLII